MRPSPSRRSGHSIVLPTYEGQDAKGLNGYGRYHEEYREVAGWWLIATLRLTRLRLEPLSGGSPDA